jgi:hypothetical protein
MWRWSLIALIFRHTVSYRPAELVHAGLSREPIAMHDCI